MKHPERQLRVIWLSSWGFLIILLQSLKKTVATQSRPFTKPKKPTKPKKKSHRPRTVVIEDSDEEDQEDQETNKTGNSDRKKVDPTPTKESKCGLCLRPQVPIYCHTVPGCAREYLICMMCYPRWLTTWASRSDDLTKPAPCPVPKRCCKVEWSIRALSIRLRSCFCSSEIIILFTSIISITSNISSVNNLARRYFNK